MEEFLMQRATDGVVVTAEKTQKQYSGALLKKLLKEVHEHTIVYEKLNRRLQDGQLLNRLLESIAGDGGVFEQKFSLKQLFQNKELLEAICPAIEEIGYDCSILLDEEHNLYSLVVQNKNTGIKISFNWEFLSSAEWQRLFELYSEMSPLEKPPLTVKENGNSVTVNSPGELLKHLLTMGKKDLSMQRYKGLGEMNPEQLWQTTMNPETRTLLKVSIDDAVQTDAIFTILMGDAVEPRRRFIEDNALNVHNLDI
jgi:DNA gyrase subunit B